MTVEVKLEAIPNQKFTVPLEGNDYSIRIFYTGECMAYNLDINKVNVIKGFQFINGELMLPYEYQEVNGNLLLIVPDDELPDYESFGNTQFLAFLTQEETDLYRESRT